jgi:3-deoxy-7-phosphoheptulonate synthase
VVYKDQEALSRSLQKLVNLPPLVTVDEVQALRKSLADVAMGKAFLLQGGDCAESFDDCSTDPIEAKVKVLLQMSLIMIWGARIPVVRIARMAGQYAKPRSSPFEMYEGRQIPSFRGHNVNGFDPHDREPNPARLVEAYFHSSATLNYLRGLLTSGFSDLRAPENWSLDWVKSGHIKEQYSQIVDRVMDCLSFMHTIGADSSDTFKSADIYTSHEGLMLDFEETMTRLARSTHGEADGYYNLGAHFIWIGDRTRQLDGAHIEYFRGLQNPLGLKVGPSMEPDELVRVLDILDPNCEPGKVTLISRYGVSKVESLLPGHIKAVQATKHKVIWACDPMHGNTQASKTHPHLKTRDFEHILGELKANLRVHQQCRSLLNAVHFEMTGESVTECIGGAIETVISTEGYQTFCDPRLNYNQAMELAFLIAAHWRDAPQA